LGALANLDQLLRSLRVGPKALSGVLPDVLDSIGPAQTAIAKLFGAVAQHLGQTTAVQELEGYVRPRLNELQQSISHATSTPMHARHRLELERVVTRIFPELEAARALLDLLEEAVAAPSIRLKLRELLSQIGMSEPGFQGRTLRTTLEGELDDVELLVQPQVAMALLTLGINLVALEVPQATPRLRVESNGDAGYRIHFEVGPDSGEKLFVLRQNVILPTTACLDEAVTRMGCRVFREPGRATFSVSWP
jgi:hypothetical protein